MLPDDLEVLARPGAHLPFVRQVIDDLAILDIIEDHCPAHPLNRVSDAECVVALILNVLCGRPALYRMDEWLGKLDVDVLFGEGADATAFNDTRLGVALEHLDAAGTDTILSDLARRYLERDTAPFTVHHDTTSVVLYGAYEADLAPGDPVPAKGHSKDRKPDLKQLIYGLSLHGSQAVPLAVTVVDGNTSDTTVARDHLRRVVELLPDERDVTFVGDSKVVDKRTIGRLLREGLHIISLLPKTFNVRQDVVDAAFMAQPDPASWPLLAQTTPRRKADPTKQYRGMSFERPLTVLLETADGEEGPASAEAMRFLVVASDSLGEQFDRQLPKKLEKADKAIRKRAVRLNQGGFSCEADARKAAEELPALAPMHKVVVSVETEEERITRSGPGRPRKDDPVQTRMIWRLEVCLEVDHDKVEAARRRASCFVLVRDWMEDAWPDDKLLAEYRQQHLIEGHTGFRWLKGPAAVAPVFLKTPRRIRAMGLVLILALMVRNYIQATMRRQLAERGETMPHPFTKKPDARLTTEMAFEHFGGLLTQIARLGEHTRRMPVRLSPPAQHLLELFGMDETIFMPRPRGDAKSRSAPLETPGM